MTSKRPPNFLFFLPDQHRPDWLGCNPHLPLRTPNLDRLCGSGVRFTNAFTAAPVCSPSRACLATGRDYYRCGVRDNRQNTPLSLPTYYRHLRDAGYDVVGVGKFDLHKPDRDWGLDGSNMVAEYGFTRGIDNEGKGDAFASFRENGMSPKGPYMQFLKENGLVDTYNANHEAYADQWFPRVTVLPDEAYCDNWVAGNAIRYLKEFHHEKPWHLVVNFVGPHPPFDVTPVMRSRWENVEIPAPVDNDEPDMELIRARRQNYAAAIENIDDHIGLMIQLVAERGELDNTIFVHSSDHGEMLGDHNRWGKSVWYTPSSGVPMILSGPGIRQDFCSDALVSMHDLAATFLDYAAASPLPDSDARSLRAVLDGKSERHRDYILSGLNDWNMVFDGHYKLVTGADPSPILYDIQGDPHELKNVAKEHPDTVENLTRILETEINRPEQNTAADADKRRR